MSPVLRASLCALPGVALGVAGLFHPAYLTYTTSHTWWVLHVVGMFVFPLVGVGLGSLVWGRRDPVALLVLLTAFVYAVAYNALDIISGIAAGWVTWKLGPGQLRPDEVSYLFRIGTPLGQVGSIALLAAVLLVLLDALRRLRLAALPAVLLLPGAYLVHTHHIFHPEGVIGMVLIGLSTGWLAWAGSTRRGAARSSRATA